MKDFKKEEMKVENLCSEMEELFKKTKEVAEKYRGLDFSQLSADDFGIAFDIMKDTAEAKMYITKAHKNMAEAKYYCALVEAMEESTYDEDYDENGPTRMGYRGQPRSKTSGRFMSRGDGRRNYEGNSRRMTPDTMYYPEPMYYPVPYYYTEGGRPSTGTSTATGSGMPRQNPNEVAHEMRMNSNEGNNRFYGDGNRSERNDRMNYQESEYDRSRRSYIEAKNKSTGSMEDNKMTMDRMNEYIDNLEDSFMNTVKDGTEQEKKMAKHRLMKMAEEIKIK